MNTLSNTSANTVGVQLLRQIEDLQAQRTSLRDARTEAKGRGAKMRITRQLRDVEAQLEALTRLAVTALAVMTMPATPTEG